jgi:uncharacterized RDD family membrane protein YckC
MSRHENPDLRNTANFAVRAIALAIDVLLITALYILVFVLLTVWVTREGIDLEPLTVLILSSSCLVVWPAGLLFLHMTYFTVFHAWSGQTIGKMILHIMVVTRDNMRVPLAVSFLRWTGYLLSSLPLAAGFLWAAVDKEHCAWHDRLAQTRVVSAEMT